MSTNHPTILVAAFGGWNDASSASSDAVRYLIENLPTRHVAVIDSDDFYDLQLTRPNVCTAAGRKNIVWPQTDFYQVTGDDLPIDLVLATGPEPSMHWKDYCRSFLRICEDLDVDRLIFLSSMFDDVAYTRPLPVSIDDGDRTDVSEDSYNGPIGIPTVLNLVAGDQGYRSEGIWICVPQYLGDSSANPQASLDLLHEFSERAHVSLPLGSLRKKAREWKTEADALMRYNDSLRSYVSSLEEAYDDNEKQEMAKAVSDGSDRLAQEAEAFLRSYDDVHPQARTANHDEGADNENPAADPADRDSESHGPRAGRKDRHDPGSSNLPSASPADPDRQQ